MSVQLNDPRMPEDTLGGSKGYILDQFSIWKGDVLRAYLKVAYKTPESIAAQTPTVYHYQAQHGWCVDLTCEMSRVAIFDKVHSWVLPYGVDYDPEWEDAIKLEYLDRFDTNYKGRKAHEDYLSDIAYFSNRPYVDYARTIREEDFRKGLATQLYRYAAKHYQERGMMLRASTLQSDEAEQLWKHFEQQGWVVSVPREEKIERFLCV
jgi:hypothetical protein